VAEIVLIVLAVMSLGLTMVVKKPVKCEVLNDAVKQEVILDEASQDVSREVAP